jgi:hypothetical protein
MLRLMSDLRAIKQEPPEARRQSACAYRAYCLALTAQRLCAGLQRLADIHRQPVRVERHHLRSGRDAVGGACRLHPRRPRHACLCGVPARAAPDAGRAAARGPRLQYTSPAMCTSGVRLAPALGG